MTEQELLDSDIDDMARRIVNGEDPMLVRALMPGEQERLDERIAFHRAQPGPHDQPLFSPPPAVPKPPPGPKIVKGRIKVRLDFEADVARLVQRFPNEYANVRLDGGYDDWERPAVFLDGYLRESLDVFLGGGDGVTDTTLFGDTEIDFKWTREDTVDLERRLS